jgi:hypothetical protein
LGVIASTKSICSPSGVSRGYSQISLVPSVKKTAPEITPKRRLALGDQFEEGKQLGMAAECSIRRSYMNGKIAS